MRRTQKCAIWKNSKIECSNSISLPNELWLWCRDDTLIHWRNRLNPNSSKNGKCKCFVASFVFICHTQSNGDDWLTATSNHVKRRDRASSLVAFTDALPFQKIVLINGYLHSICIDGIPIDAAMFHTHTAHSALRVSISGSGSFQMNRFMSISPVAHSVQFHSICTRILLLNVIFVFERRRPVVGLVSLHSLNVKGDKWMFYLFIQVVRCVHMGDW